MASARAPAEGSGRPVGGVTTVAPASGSGADAAGGSLVDLGGPSGHGFAKLGPRLTVSGGLVAMAAVTGVASALALLLWLQNREHNQRAQKKDTK